VRALSDEGHDIVVLTRRASAGGNLNTVRWAPDGGVGEWARTIDGADAVVNLAGEPIAGRRWTRAQKQRILDSRVLATRSLAAAIAGAARPPRVLVSGSGVGYYGPRGDEIVTEETGPGSDFLARVCQAWESEALAAERAGTSVALVRTGLVLARDGGALREIMRPFTFFVGGALGSGRQYMPWIHRDDWVGIVRMLLLSPSARGAFNATGPSPAANEAFTRALARAMQRPALMRAPAFALKLALGEMAESLLLTGQRAVPARAVAMGYRFKHATIDEALAAILAPS
jgi:hypothetical protein